MRQIKILIVIVFGFAVGVNAFANTSISYSGNVSAEFPNAAAYNNFTSSLTNTFNNININQYSHLSAIICNYPTIILDELIIFPGVQDFQVFQN